MAKFSVDTKLFRELGELLVGRESTAMVELIKNAYDADATLVKVFGKNLNDPNSGTIVIEDNGVGMDAETFKSGFLTIAGRTRTKGDRYSDRFERRYTGEKGVGRLSAHKLASHLEVRSSKWNGGKPDDFGNLPASEGVIGIIDWKKIEARDTLDDITDDDVSVKDSAPSNNSGTRLTLTHLQRKWDKRAFDDFFSDVSTLVPSEELSGTLSSKTVPKSLLFDRPTIRRRRAKDLGFDIEYSGDFSPRESELPVVSESAYWVIEIVCDPTKGKVSIAVAPTLAAKRNPKFKNAENWSGSFQIPKDTPAVPFTARILEKEGSTWPRRFQGIRVYLEGFRIPPYGDANDDWLNLDREYRSRGKGELKRLSQFTDWKPPKGDEDEGTDVKGNANYFGAVFLTRDDSESLKMLVNREGFLPSEEWDCIVDVIRWGIGVQVRQRTMARLLTRTAKPNATEEEIEARKNVLAEADEASPPSAFQAKSLQTEALDIIREAKVLIASGQTREATKRLDRVERVTQEARQISIEGASEAVMYRILASVGLEQAAFVHEILGLALTAETIANALSKLSKSVGDVDTRRRLKALVVEANELRDALRRNGIYLTDMTGVDGRKRRSRLKLRNRLDTVLAFFEPVITKRKITIENEIPEDLVSSPIFPAEASALFSNLISNAIKFSAVSGKVKISGQSVKDEIKIKVENTGEKVDLKTAEKWFDPFRSTTSKADPTLGQGMGLGLTVSRSLMEEYGGSIEFVSPSNGFVTAIELTWPRR